MWNNFVDLLAHGDYAYLDERQRPAYLIFWYESEVQNGGHVQYFLNRGIKHVPETIEALRAHGALSLADILSRGLALWPSVDQSRARGESIHAFFMRALDAGFRGLDDEFSRDPVNLTKVLEDILARNEDHFVLRV